MRAMSDAICTPSVDLVVRGIFAATHSATFWAISPWSVNTFHNSRSYSCAHMRASVRVSLTSLSFGNDVCHIWHGLTNDDTKCGVWMFLFYSAVCFICFHGDKNLIAPQATEEGYKESPKLPPKL